MKVELANFPRHVGLSPGHLSECLLVGLVEVAERYDYQGPLYESDAVYCTCDDWSPDQ